MRLGTISTQDVWYHTFTVTSEKWRKAIGKFDKSKKQFMKSYLSYNLRGIKVFGGCGE
jgi:hypothetical protein